MRSIPWVLVIGGMMAIGCTPKPKNIKEPVQVERQPAEGRSLSPDPCMPYKEPNFQTPTFVKTSGGGYIVTRVMKACVTRDGARGFERGSPWMAMGIPCTLGGGRISIRGKSYAPKMISMSVATDCGMDPTNPVQVQDTTNRLLGFDSGNRLLAYNPLSVQYWEVEGYRDAGVGESIELRTTDAVGIGWKDFRDNNKPLVVHLFGRENAWVQDSKMFEVKVEINKQPPLAFKAKVLDVRVLSPTQIEAAKERCLAIGLRRRCGEVFN